MIRGFVRGKTIELDHETGLPDGQEVAVTFSPVIDDDGECSAQDGLQRAFGGWADDDEGLDDYLEWNRQQRKVGRAEQGS